MKIDDSSTRLPSPLIAHECRRIVRHTKTVINAKSHYAITSDTRRRIRDFSRIRASAGTRRQLLSEASHPENERRDFKGPGVQISAISCIFRSRDAACVVLRLDEYEIATRVALSHAGSYSRTRACAAWRAARCRKEREAKVSEHVLNRTQTNAPSRNTTTGRLTDRLALLQETDVSSRSSPEHVDLASSYARPHGGGCKHTTTLRGPSAELFE